MKTPFAASRRQALVAATILSAALAGCTQDRASTTTTTTDSAGIRIVTSAGPGWTPAGAWSLELELEVGATDGPDAFGSIRDVAPRRAGGLWILDGQAQRIRAYDETGAEVASFGRKGMGPGETMGAAALAETADGALSVGESFPVVLHTFSPDGEPLDRRPIEQTAYRAVPGPNAPARPPLGPSLAEWQFAADGSAYAQAMTLDAPNEEIVRTDVLLRLADGHSVDEADPVRLADWSAPMTVGGPEGEVRLFEPTASWSPASGGGVWLTHGDRYEIRLLDGSGKLLEIVRRAEPRHAVTDELARTLRAGLAEDTRDEMTSAMLDRAVFPDSLPATLGLWYAAPDGGLRVGVVDPERAWDAEAANALDVFGTEGKYLGRLPLPSNLRPTRVTADHVYGIWRDELDVPHARRYRIVR